MGPIAEMNYIIFCLLEGNNYRIVLHFKLNSYHQFKESSSCRKLCYCGIILIVNENSSLKIKAYSGVLRHQFESLLRYLQQRFWCSAKVP